LDFIQGKKLNLETLWL